MGKVLKKITALSLCVMMIVPFISFTTSAETENNFKEYVVEAEGIQRTSNKNTDSWAKPKYSYIYEYNNNIVIVDVDKYVTATTYTKDFEFISEKKIAFELPLFGGFYSGKEFNFIVFGQTNNEENIEKEVFRVVKYDKEFNRISHASIDCNQETVYVPFGYGSCRIAEFNNELTVHTCRVMFMSNDGKRHQANRTILINTETMTTIDYNQLTIDNYVSHSLNQFVHYDEEKRVFVDHGDSYPRSVILFKHQKNDEYNDAIFSKIDLFDIPGAGGANCTGVNVGGFEISDNNYIVSINTIDHSKVTKYTSYTMEGLDVDSRDAVLLVSNKNNTSEDNVKQIYLTDYIKNNKHATAPYLVKLSEKRFVAMWKEFLIEKKISSNGYEYSDYIYNGIRYVIIDENGNNVTDIKQLNSSILLSDDCQPVFIDNKILWYYNSNKTERHICSIDLSNELCKEHKLVRIPFKNATCIKAGNNEYYKCSDCSVCFKDNNGSQKTSVQDEVIPLIPHQGGEPFCALDSGICSLCGTKYVPFQEHIFGEYTLVDEPKCTLGGNYKAICQVCNETWYPVIKPLGHSIDNPIIITDATCTSEGLQSGLCTTCKKDVTVKIPAKGHQPGNEWTVDKEVTCLIDGSKSTSCIDCGEIITERIATPNQHTPEDNWNEITEPTCDSRGSKSKKCSVCGDFAETLDIPPLEHSESDWITIQIPTAEKSGERIKVCTVCSEIIEREAIPVSDIPKDSCVNHTSSEEWDIIIEATCNNKGLKVNKCIKCNYIIDNDKIDALYHDYEKKVISESTCTTKGINHYICTLCGNLGWTSESSLRQHIPGEWETIVEANCGNPGQKVKKCTMCQEVVESEEIPALTTHTPGAWEVVTAATCTTVGKKVQKCTGCGEIIDEDIIPTSEHTAGEWQYAMYPTCSKEGMEVLKCNVCGVQIEYRSVPALPHTPSEWVTVEEAKCGVDGKKSISCTVCGTEIESEIIDAPEHVESDWIIVREPTCSKEGIKQKRCTVCLEYISDRYEKIDKLPHNPASYWTNVSNATCTEDGLKIKKCTVCGETAEEMVIEANGHTSGDWKTIISPTCNGAGVKIKTCNVCGEESQRMEINPTGHTPSSEWTLRKLATCTEDGEMYKKCIACGMDAETKTVDALGHNLDSEWNIEQNATCTEDGTKTQTCTRCDYTVSETIPATGHTETGWLITATADCVNSGTKIKKCTVCGIQTDSVSIPATGHTIGEWEILETSTCSREGTRVKRCSDCGTVTKSEAIPRSGHEKGNWVITETPTGGSYGVKARFCIGCGMKMEEKIIYSVSNVVVKDNATGIEVVYPDGTFTGTMTVSARNISGSEIGSKVYAKLGECNFKGYEVKFYENGVQVNPSNTYSVRIPVPYSYNKNSAEVYGISMTTGELYKVSASYENGYFLIENADTVQYVIAEKIITLSLSQTHLDMNKGDSVQLYAYTNGQNVTFTSSNTSVATVDIYGNVTAVGSGSAVITATVDGTTVKEECTVEVTQSFFDMIISAITEAFSSFFKFFTDIFKSINGSLS